MVKHRDDLDRVFHALSDATRRAVVERLTRSPATSSDLAAPFDVSLPAVMKHLTVLEETGIVESHKIGRTRTYQLAPSALAEAVDWLGRQRTQAEAGLDRLGDLLSPPQEEA